MGGIKIAPDVDIANINIKNGDIMILPGADTWLDGTNNEILNFAEQNIDKNITIAAICGATIALAYKGLLDKRKHTSNDLGFLKTVCPNYNGEMYYCNQHAVTENNLITASGIAPLEFTCEVIKKLNIMEKTTIEAWYNLYRTKESKYFFELMDSLK
jgi:putative intracellular protease/amidase